MILAGSFLTAYKNNTLASRVLSSLAFTTRLQIIESHTYLLMLFSQQLLTTFVSRLSCSSMILPLHCPLQNFALKCIYSGALYLNFYPHQSNCAPVHSHYNTTELIEMTQCSTELLPQGSETNCDRINSN